MTQLHHVFCVGLTRRHADNVKLLLLVKLQEPNLDVWKKIPSLVWKSFCCKLTIRSVEAWKKAWVEYQVSETQMAVSLW